ncbi:putative 5-dehydro-4-deoxyglucarate dehydratase 1 [Sphaerisporangium melleum]|uniref:Probable 5-dehydro-4-deoxyglucarate dehydratase n=2 Tax=Sphaerisporangium melleum TaxID=321316 RepID=A0A917R103_9ACTN|nr:5-dehydro-4-deoxyglucarate dehydratase [Sphaerisporangium melleum]GGK83294.1 putative 5-dehydro-4-deoxyglucarate dehydratase 1 [Sphaerisporangium melleum]GII69259.1 putative 5-dehydro-4-deoxyglucarate dehydratase 1 [Sphaerisporangium melleum]
MNSLVDRLDGPLFFPVTPCDDRERLDLDAFREHVRDGVAAGCGAVFACCGTGEFPSLSPSDYAACVAAAVEETAGRVPVIAGTGYATALASLFVAAAEEAGADGLLALPPYLVQPDQEGLRRHYRSLADGTRLPVILYQRDNAIFEPRTVVDLARHPRIVGLKDGHGDLDLLQRTISAVRSATTGLTFFNGLPTAEMSALAYRGLGVTRYSSAVFCFAPTVAMAFYKALLAGDDPVTDRLIDEFYRPLVELRRQGAGYAVSLVKAGVRLRGLDVGPVRAPLCEPAPEHIKRLAELIDRALEIVDGL